MCPTKDKYYDWALTPLGFCNSLCVHSKIESKKVLLIFSVGPVKWLMDSRNDVQVESLDPANRFQSMERDTV